MSTGPFYFNRLNQHFLTTKDTKEHQGKFCIRAHKSLMSKLLLCQRKGNSDPPLLENLKKTFVVLRVLCGSIFKI